MKRNILSLAVAASVVGGVASTANAAMYINDKGLGEALVYPFYSAAGGNDTYISVVNTTNQVKAVKIRFIEGLESQEVLDFNLYLSPEDVWAGVITANPNGDGAIIRSADTSCTVPTLGTAVGNPAYDGVTNGMVKDQPFVPYNFREDDSLTTDDRTLEGYVEMFEMGQLETSTVLGAAAEHEPSTGIPVPADCGALVDAWTAGLEDAEGAPVGAEWIDDPREDFAPWNGGGLYGYGIVINPADGTAVGYDAIAIDEYFDDRDAPAGPGIAAYHASPGTTLPNFTIAQPNALVNDGGTAREMNFTAATDDLNALDATSALFMSLNIANDYVIDPVVNGLTDWVVTMPTKQAYTATDRLAPVAPATVGELTPARAPFTNRWDGTRACEPVGFVSWDREESPTETPIDGPTGPIFSPAPPAPPGTPDPDDFVLCTEMSVISFGEESALNATENTRYGAPSPDGVTGWARLSFDPADLFDSTGTDRQLTDETTTVYGLPVVGFAVQKYQNAALDGTAGVVANYAAAIEHKSVTSVDVVN